MKKRYLSVLFFFVFLCWACSGNRNDGNGGGDNPLGQSVYQQYCVLCHGKDGNLGLNGSAKLTESNMSRAEVVNIIKKGKAKMTPFEGMLSEAQIESVADYVISLRKK